jgi:hypothetical protein
MAEEGNRNPRQPIVAYGSFHDLQAQHNQLLQRYEQGDRNAPGPSLLEEAETFLHRAQKTGAIIERSADRWQAQSFLTLWSSVLYRADRQIPEGALTLDRLDREALTKDLPEQSNPYPGLRPFTYRERRVFFGRENQIQNLVTALEQPGVVLLSGAPGIGKTSFIHAGLLSVLLADTERIWHVFRPFAPGDNPFLALAQALCGAGLGSGREEEAPRDIQSKTDQRGQYSEEEPVWTVIPVSERNLTQGRSTQELAQHLAAAPHHLAELMAEEPADEERRLLIVDAAEDLYVRCPQEMRLQFLHCLQSLLERTKRVCVLIAVQNTCANELATELHLQRSSEGSDAWQELGELRAVELQAAIEKPAEQAELRIHADVVGELVREVVNEPSSLCLLAFALRHLWGQKDRNRITFQVYSRMGPPALALVGSAEEAYRTLSAEDRLIVDDILLPFALKTETRDITAETPSLLRKEIRRILSKRSEHIMPERGPQQSPVDRALLRLEQAGAFRMTPGSSAEDDRFALTHPVLMRTWSRLDSIVRLNQEKREKEAYRKRVKWYSLVGWALFLGLFLMVVGFFEIVHQPTKPPYILILGGLFVVVPSIVWTVVTVILFFNDHRKTWRKRPAERERLGSDT